MKSTTSSFIVNVTAGSPCLYPILTTSDAGTTGPVGPSYTDSFNFSVGTTLTSGCTATPQPWCDRAKTYLLPNGVINGVAAERP